MIKLSLSNTFSTTSFINGDISKYALITYNDIHKLPERDVTTQEIAGRNGDLTLDNGRWKAIDITYHLEMPASMNGRTCKENLDNILAVIQPTDTYSKWYIQDDTEGTLNDKNNWFREGYLSGAIAPAWIGQNHEACTLDLTFHCRPELFLIGGRTRTIITKGSTITNPCYAIAKPWLMIIGYGVLTFGSYTVTIQSDVGAMAPTYIDCYAMDCYDASGNNVNKYVTLSNGFPQIAGQNEGGSSGTITWDSNIKSVAYEGRWRDYDSYSISI